MAPHPTSTMRQTQRTLEECIAANRKVQDAIKEQLILLGRKKAENRNLASKLTQHITLAWQQLDHNKMGNIPEIGTKDKANTRSTKFSALAKWKYDPYRKWTRCFFTDPNSSTPQPNDDVRQRRTMEHGNIFFHTHPPWGHAEYKTLRLLVQQQEKQQKDTNIDWIKVAADLQAKETLSRTRDTKVPRTPEECRLVYLGLINQTPFTKEESIAILKQIHSQGKNPSWTTIQLDGRTTWQIFCHHQKMKLSSHTTSKAEMWTIRQDELLLKYLAAMGPQYILNLAEACRLSMKLLQNKTPKAIMSRANQSLLNPNMARSAWSTDEDMTLVLALKVYKNDANPLIAAGNHLPRRASQSISAKWHRSLDPNYSTLPWTTLEETRLIDIVKNSNTSWTDVARKYFPERNPRTIQAKWTEVASSDDLIHKYGEALKKQKARGTILGADDFVIRVKPTTVANGSDEEESL